MSRFISLGEPRVVKLTSRSALSLGDTYPGTFPPPCKKIFVKTGGILHGKGRASGENGPNGGPRLA